MLLASRPSMFVALFTQRSRRLFSGALAGVGWMLLACCCFSVMGIFVKISKTYFYFSEIVLYRNLPTVLILGSIMPWKRASLKTNYLREQLKRATLGCISMTLGFFANIHLPLALAMTLSYTTPIFLALLGVFWFKQTLGKGLVFCIVMGFIGIMILLRPGALAQEDSIAGLAGLGAGLFAAFAYLNIQWLAKGGEPEWRTVFYFALISTVYAFIADLIFNGHFHALNLKQVMLIAVLGSTGLLGQLCLTRAFGRGHPNVTSLFSYSTLLLSSLWGWMFFNEHLDRWSSVGACIVLLSGLLATWFKPALPVAPAEVSQ